MRHAWWAVREWLQAEAAVWREGQAVEWSSGGGAATSQVGELELEAVSMKGPCGSLSVEVIQGGF